MAHRDAPKRKKDGSLEVVNDDGTRSFIWGVASTGQVARQGIAELVDHADGSKDAIVRPQPVNTGIRSGYEKRPDDFTLDDFQLDLSALAEQITAAVRSGRLKTRPAPDGKGRIVDPRDFQKWVAGL